MALNRPGMPKPYSITATLISSVEMFTPVIAAIAGVTTGSACRLATRPTVRPFARAVRTKSSSRASTIVFSVSRSTYAASGSAHSTHGTHIAFKNRSGFSLKPV